MKEMVGSSLVGRTVVAPFTAPGTCERVAAAYLGRDGIVVATIDAVGRPHSHRLRDVRVRA